MPTKPDWGEETPSQRRENKGVPTPPQPHSSALPTPELPRGQILFAIAFPPLVSVKTTFGLHRWEGDSDPQTRGAQRGPGSGWTAPTYGHRSGDGVGSAAGRPDLGSAISSTREERFPQQRACFPHAASRYGGHRPCGEQRGRPALRPRGDVCDPYGGTAAGSPLRGPASAVPRSSPGRWRTPQRRTRRAPRPSACRDLRLGPRRAPGMSHPNRLPCPALGRAAAGLGGEGAPYLRRTAAELPSRPPPP